MVVAANNRGTCFVWRLDPANQFEPLHKVDAHNTYCLKALLSPDVKYVIGACGGGDDENDGGGE